MDLLSQTHWFAVQVKPRREKFAASSIEEDGVQVFLPMLKQRKVIRRVAKTVVKPLFPGYLFARFCPRSALDQVRYAKGVVRIIFSKRIPVPVGNEVIDEIQSRTGEEGCVGWQPTPLEPGHTVRVEQGPFQGVMGKVEREWDDGKRVMILLDMLHQARVILERHWVEPAEATV
jgi:transcriptional antiterminator RfaH